MEKLLLDERHVLDYVEDNIISCLSERVEVYDDKFHHNTKYKDALSIIKNGILSPSELSKLGIDVYSDEILSMMSDIESHANGSDSISLAVVGLTDLKPDEFEYDPFSEKLVDFIITSDITARRVTTNYGNEYLTDDSICTDKFKAIDIRLLSFVNSIREERNVESFSSSVNELIENYNKLRDMARLLKDMKLSIPLREMSFYDNTALDIDKMYDMPKVKVKS